MLRLPVDPVVFHIAGAFGPCLAAAAVVFTEGGTEWLRRLVAPYRRWRAAGAWYAFVLLARPTVWLAALAVYVAAGTRSFALPEIDAGFTALYLASQLLVVGVGEELGWAGFAFPRLRERYGFLAANLILGALWGLWHLPFFFTAGASQ